MLDLIVSQYRKLAKHQSVSLPPTISLEFSLRIVKDRNSCSDIREPTLPRHPSLSAASYKFMSWLAGSTISRRIIPLSFRARECICSNDIHIRELDSALSVTSGPFVPWTPVISLDQDDCIRFFHSTDTSLHDVEKRGARRRRRKERRRRKKKKKRRNGSLLSSRRGCK